MGRVGRTPHAGRAGSTRLLRVSLRQHDRRRHEVCAGELLWKVALPELHACRSERGAPLRHNMHALPCIIPIPSYMVTLNSRFIVSCVAALFLPFVTTFYTRIGSHREKPQSTIMQSTQSIRYYVCVTQLCFCFTQLIYIQHHDIDSTDSAAILCWPWRSVGRKQRSSGCRRRWQDSQSKQAVCAGA